MGKHGGGGVPANAAPPLGWHPHNPPLGAPPVWGSWLGRGGDPYGGPSACWRSQKSPQRLPKGKTHALPCPQHHWGLATVQPTLESPKGHQPAGTKTHAKGPSNPVAPCAKSTNTQALLAIARAHAHQATPRPACTQGPQASQALGVLTHTKYTLTPTPRQ